MHTKVILKRIFLYSFYCGCLLAYALFHGSKYDWMDAGWLAPPSAAPLTWVDNSASSRSVFRGAVVATLVGMQLLIYSKFSSHERTLTSILLAIVLIAFW